MIIINKQNKNTKISSKRKEFQENLATFMLLILKIFFCILIFSLFLTFLVSIFIGLCLCPTEQAPLLS